MNDELKNLNKIKGVALSRTADSLNQQGQRGKPVSPLKAIMVSGLSSDRRQTSQGHGDLGFVVWMVGKFTR